MKTCKKCNTQLDESEFLTRTSRGKVYILGSCYACAAKASLNYLRKHPDRHLLSMAKQRAKKFQLEFNITIEDIVIPKICPVLGIPIDRSSYDNLPTLDRIDNLKGYIKGNIAVISMRANAIKNDGNAEDHRKIAEYIRDHQRAR